MPKVNIVDTNGAGGTAGRIVTPILATRATGYDYSDANGYLEFGSGTDGALPFRVDQSGNVTANGVPFMQLAATTGASGFALQNGTPGILSWTAPNDGNPHRVLLIGNQNVSSAETGGQVNATFTRADNSGTSTTPVFGGSAGTGYHGIGNNSMMVAPGTTVTVTQGTALTAGAGTVWIEMWAS